MSALQFKKRMTKSAFDQRLQNELGAEGLSCCPYVEQGRKMTLYYNNGVHCGTWMGGQGWAFKHAYESK